MYSIEELNDIQKRAVLETDGAVLVTAGAGSGKTRLLTHRIAHLIDDLGVKPYNILAITFTNKAAGEMRSRLASMLDTDGIWIFTFHAACVRILRKYIDKLGFDKNFSIYGESETKALIKQIVKRHDYDDDMVKRISGAISDAKNRGIAPSDYSAVYKFSADADEIATAYSEYQKLLRANNALDYDDLLIFTLRLLEKDGEALDYYQKKFMYIHIDEFQDTNVIQYKIVKLLAGGYGNIFAVGDEDQCIYTWRGASVANIFDFQRDFKCKVFKLEQNYRSTEKILSIANRIIKGNTQRLDKKLWTNNDSGENVVCFGAQTDGFEADFVVRTIYELTHERDLNYSDCAVLMRLNALTRRFEERFLQYNIPYKVIGGFKFYDRKEVKDVLAYARLAVNPSDDEAAYRIINFPKRGIGETSIEKIRDYTAERGISVYDTVTQTALPFNAALNEKLARFGNTLMALRERAFGEVTAFFRYLLFDVLNVIDLFKTDSEGEARLENLNELISSVRDFSENNPDADLNDYLQTVSLYSDTDDMTGDNVVTVATVHSAKGLEFPAVFVVGLEDRVFPSIREGESDASHIEEERRLMYVAVTRAKQRLFLSYAKSRFLYGETRYNIPSRFLVEAGLVEKTVESDDLSERVFRSVAELSRAVAGGYASARPPRETFSSQESVFNGAYKSSYGKKPDRSVDADSDSIKDKVQLGATVLHRRFGKGKVIGLEQLGDNVYARIDFEVGGVMQLALGVAPLTIVEED